VNAPQSKRFASSRTPGGRDSVWSARVFSTAFGRGEEFNAKAPRCQAQGKPGKGERTRVSRQLLRQNLFPLADDASQRAQRTVTVSLLGNLGHVGFQTTTFVPCANRRAYLPRTPREKSYSARICEPAGLLTRFFIRLSFSFAGGVAR